jgi:hypothetical protein
MLGCDRFSVVVENAIAFFGDVVESDSEALTCQFAFFGNERVRSHS